MHKLGNILHIILHAESQMKSLQNSDAEFSVEVSAEFNMHKLGNILYRILHAESRMKSLQNQAYRNSYEIPAIMHAYVLPISLQNSASSNSARISTKFCMRKFDKNCLQILHAGFRPKTLQSYGRNLRRIHDTELRQKSPHNPPCRISAEISAEFCIQKSDAIAAEFSM